MATFLRPLAVFVMASMALAIGSGRAAETITLKVGHDSPTTHPYQRLFEKFKNVLEAESNGAVEVQIYPDGQLGDEPQMLEGLRLGTLDAQIAVSINLSQFVPEAELFNLPFLFKDLHHVYAVTEGPVGERMAKAIESRLGAVVLGWTTAGTRVVWNNKRPIVEPADLHGVKMRVMATPIMVDTFNKFGASAATIPFLELYTALQQGVVDGADNDVVDLLTLKFYEVTKYVSLTNHVILPAAFVFSKRRFDSMPPELQRAVVKAGREAILVGRDAQEELAAAATKELKQKGLQFNEVDKAAFESAAQEIYAKYAESVGGMDLINEIRHQ